MAKKEVIVLSVKAKDFRGNDFLSNHNCAIARALKRRFPDEKVVGECLGYAYVGGKNYNHRYFGELEFLEWQKKVYDEDIEGDVTLFKMRLTFDR